MKKNEIEYREKNVTYRIFFCYSRPIRVLMQETRPALYLSGNFFKQKPVHAYFHETNPADTFELS